MAQVEIGLRFDRELDPILIGFFVCLGTWTVHRRAFTNVEHPKLNPRSVDRLAHQSAQGIDLADEVAFGDTTDGGVAAHLADGVQVGG